MNIVLYIGTFFFYREISKRRDIRWDAMNEKQPPKYLETTKDEGTNVRTFGSHINEEHECVKG
ncbi:hypothetical protein BDN71DRAFT_1437680 [Pleurotus eryngii]|uniref:Uncharacterized protein n=1 Tax=Pleurotus eryngii TaxID=5323 RepID=A0A9P6AA69_PLEER|nr:hypothetical protein BDN71DRAFT_1437680 [Pleurotus eryngii]